jgi:hypothetical protein
VAASILVAFYLCWQLTLVVMGMALLIAAAGAYMITAVAAAQVRGYRSFTWRMMVISASWA